MKTRNQFILILFSALLVFVSCKKPKTYPDVPEITFKEFQRFVNDQGIDDSVKVVISFTDGDGDIGLSQSDTNPPFDPSSIYYYDFYTKFFIKQNGTFVELPTFLPGSRIPFISNENKIKTLTGDIITKLDIFGFIFNNDTLRFECYIYDRALHKSNTLTTPEIILKTQ